MVSLLGGANSSRRSRKVTAGNRAGVLIGGCNLLDHSSPDRFRAVRRVPRDHRMKQRVHDAGPDVKVVAKEMEVTKKLKQCII